MNGHYPQLPDGTEYKHLHEKNHAQNTQGFYVEAKMPGWPGGLKPRLFAAQIEVEDFQFFNKDPAQIQADIAHQLRLYLQAELFNYLEDQVTLLPNREQLAKIIESASAEFGDTGTPQMLSDYILLKLSESPQVIKPAPFSEIRDALMTEPVSVSAASQLMGELSKGYNPTMMLAMTMYLKTVAHRNIKEITGEN